MIVEEENRVISLLIFTKIKYILQVGNVRTQESSAV